MTEIETWKAPKVAKKVIDICAVLLNLTRVILLIILVGYCALGAYIFELLEGPNELKSQETANSKELQFRQAISKQCSNVNLDDILVTLDQRSLTIHTEKPSLTPRWDFYGSFFFATTVVSTIGFGNLAPVTVEGQIFCVGFAVIGIPLCILTLARVGEWFVITRNWLSDRIKSKLGKRLVRTFLILLWPIILVFLPAAIYSQTECKWNFSTSLYFDFITLSTIGFGDYIVSGNCIYDPKWKAVHKCAFFIWIVFGLSFVAQVINEIRQALDKLETYVRQKLVKQSNTVEPEDNVTEVSETD